MSVRLEQLLAAKPATGPRLFTLDEQRDMARLLIDMGEALLWTDNSLTHVLSGRPHRAIAEVHAANEALLARLDALGKDTT